MSAHAGSSSLDFPFWEALAKEAKKPLVIAVPRDEEAAAVAAAAPSAKVRAPSPSPLLSSTDQTQPLECIADPK